MNKQKFGCFLLLPYNLLFFPSKLYHQLNFGNLVFWKILVDRNGKKLC